MIGGKEEKGKSKSNLLMVTQHRRKESVLQFMRHQPPEKKAG